MLAVCKSYARKILRKCYKNAVEKDMYATDPSIALEIQYCTWNCYG
jgi:hypothetical protein